LNKNKTIGVIAAAFYVPQFITKHHKQYPILFAHYENIRDIIITILQTWAVNFYGFYSLLGGAQ